jgi:hypothetical protein
MSVIDFGDSQIGLITIAGIAYVQEDGGLRKATDEEIAAAAIAKARRAAGAGGTGITLNFGDIAGGDVIKINIKR